MKKETKDKLMKYTIIGLIITIICICIYGYSNPVIRNAQFCPECYSGFTKWTDLIPVFIIAIITFITLFVCRDRTDKK